MNKKKNKKRISKLENFNKKRESYTKFLVEKRETKKIKDIEIQNYNFKI